MTSEVMLQLASVPQLRVADPVSLIQASRNDASVPSIAARLGTSSVLRGTIRHAGGRMRVSAQLLRADGHQLWAGSYDRPAAEAVAMAQDIRRGIVAALGVTTSPSAR